MNEEDLPVPEEAAANTAGDQTDRTGRGTGLAASPESATDLNSAKASPTLAGDILHGADAVAEFLYGDRKSRRKVYHLVENANLPVFRLGVNICARKSVLLEWIGRQERRQVVVTPPFGVSTEVLTKPPR